MNHRANSMWLDVGERSVTVDRWPKPRNAGRRRFLVLGPLDSANPERLRGTEAYGWLEANGDATLDYGSVSDQLLEAMREALAADLQR